MKNIPQVKLPFIHEKAISIYNQFTLLAENRDGLLEFLRKNFGILSLDLLIKDYSKKIKIKIFQFLDLFLR